MNAISFFSMLWSTLWMSLRDALLIALASSKSSMTDNQSTVSDVVNKYVKYTGSHIEGVLFGKSSHYDPISDKVQVEERLVKKNLVLAVFVGLHEAAHAYQQDRVILSVWFTYVIAWLRFKLRISFILTGLLIILMIIFKSLAWWFFWLVVVATLSVLFFEWEASYKANKYAEKELKIVSPESKRYLSLAFSTYLIFGFLNICEAYIFIKYLSTPYFLVALVVLAVMRYITGKSIKKGMEAIEEKDLSGQLNLS